MNKRLWRFPMLSAIAALVSYIPLLYAKSFDLESIGYLFILVLLTIVFGIGILLRRILLKRWVNLTSIFTVLAFLGVSTGMFFSTEHLRPWARWLVASGRYTSLVLQQEPDRQTGLRFVEWDAWGWAGMDTSVELVYDPTDTLDREIKHNPKGRFADVAEKTAFVQRLGRGWYSLTLYTGEVL
jgi:hypothetical protein